MNLCLDIGNTRSKGAIFEAGKNKLIDFFVLKELTSTFLAKKINTYAVQQAIISSTKKEEAIIAFFLQNKLDYFLKFDAQTPIPIQNHYATPQTLGRDRLAAAIAASDLYPHQNTLIIDAGTCITYDFLDATSSYKGGGISAGLQIRFKALHQFTDKLPLIDFNITDSIGNLIGDNTRKSILSGVLWGTVAELDGIIDRYRLQYPQLKVLLTGGDANFFDTTLKNEIFAKPYLVLEGLNNILNFNIKLNVKKAT